MEGHKKACFNGIDPFTHFYLYVSLQVAMQRALYVD
jgi:hypothetical protein